MAVNKYNNLDQESRDKHTYLDKKIIPLSDREATCLQYYLATNFDREFAEMPFTNLQKHLVSVLLEYDDYSSLVDKGLLFTESSLIPEEKFQWLINDLRAQIFTINFLLNNKSNESDILNYGSSVMDSIYSYFDFLRSDFRQVPLDKKVALLARAKTVWDAVCEKDKYSKWLKEDNVKQIEKVCDYLKKNNRYVDANIDNSNYSEIRSRVLASLDLIDPLIYIPTSRNYKQSDTKTLFISKMKNTWVQQKQRDDGKTKKPYHLPLTLSTKANLEELAGFNNLTTAKQLEVLINSAHEKIFIDDNGQRIYYT